MYCIHSRCKYIVATKYCAKTLCYRKKSLRFFLLFQILAAMRVFLWFEMVSTEGYRRMRWTTERFSLNLFRFYVGKVGYTSAFSYCFYVRIYKWDAICLSLVLLLFCKNIVLYHFLKAEVKRLPDYTDYGNTPFPKNHIFL